MLRTRVWWGQPSNSGMAIMPGGHMSGKGVLFGLQIIENTTECGTNEYLDPEKLRISFAQFCLGYIVYSD